MDKAGSATKRFGISGLHRRRGVFGNGTGFVRNFDCSEHDESAEGALIGEVEAGFIAVKQG